MLEIAKSERFTRLRALFAAVAFVASAWYCFHGLAWLARSVGIVPIVNYNPEVRQWLVVGDPILQSWHEVSISEDFTLAGYALVFLTAVLAYYICRLVYHLDFGKVFQRRDRWLLAGWLIGTPIIAVEGHFLLELLSEPTPAHQWPTFSGAVVLVVFLGSASLFSIFWAWVMRKRRVFLEYPGS